MLFMVKMGILINLRGLWDQLILLESLIDFLIGSIFESPSCYQDQLLWSEVSGYKALALS